MSFFAHDRWVWDFWIADDGDRFHLFYLCAPKSLGDPGLRHRNATIGHAVSTDLRSWTDAGTALTPGGAGDFDETATWTGSVVRGDDGMWRMFYTGSRFLDPEAHTNVESIGLAVSDDLETWTKVPGLLLAADPRRYEVLGDGSWHEEAWRDPWVERDGGGWRMLVTARSRPVPGAADPRDAGVVGVARSSDLDTWQLEPAASDPGAGFAHLEVLQTFAWNGSDFVIFSCDTAHLAGERAARGDRGGIWVAPVEGGRFEIDRSRLLAEDWLYAGKIVRDRDDRLVLMGFVNSTIAGEFDGSISDPIPLLADEDGWPRVDPRLAPQAG